MAGRRATRSVVSREQWTAQLAGGELPANDIPAKTPISAERIVAAALEVIEVEGFDALTMRRVSAALGTGPASLYAHVTGKSELDDLLIGELCSRVVIPVADPAQWQDQYLDVCAQLREQFLAYPGVARAALAAAPTTLASLRVAEGLLTILLAGLVAPQCAAWTSDATFLYVVAYCMEAGIAHHQGQDVDGHIVDRAEIIQRLQLLPRSQFPNTLAHVRELTAGEGHDRFDFTLRSLLRGVS